MLHWINRAERFRISGVEVLRCRISLPQWAEYGGLSDFYRELGDRAFGFCQDILRPDAEAVYERSEDERKRFRFPAFSYELTGEVCWQEADLLSVRIRAELCRRGSPEPLSRGWDAHTWQLGGGEPTLLPPEQVVQAVAGKALPKRKRKGARGVLIDGGRLWLCRSDGWEELFCAEEAPAEGETDPNSL